MPASPMVACPYCRADVTPLRDAEGRLVCPVCANTGAAAPAVASAWGAEATPDRGGAPYPPARTPGLAIAALVVGIVAILTVSGVLLVGIAAVVLGAVALRRIRRSNGQLRGKGLAATGLALGAASLVAAFVIVAASVAYATSQQHAQGAPGGADATGLDLSSTCGTVDPKPANQGPPRLPEWTPPPGTVPEDGRFAYFESDPTDVPGLGLTTAYGPGCTFSPSQYGHMFRVSPQGEPSWDLRLQYRASDARFVRGVYENVGNPLDNPEAFGLVAYTHHVCNDVRSTVIIDEATYDDVGRLVRLTFRFEEHCQGAPPATMGYVRWVA